MTSFAPDPGDPNSQLTSFNVQNAAAEQEMGLLCDWLAKNNLRLLHSGQICNKTFFLDAEPTIPFVAVGAENEGLSLGLFQIREDSAHMAKLVETALFDDQLIYFKAMLCLQEISSFDEQTFSQCFNLASGAILEAEYFGISHPMVTKMDKVSPEQLDQYLIDLERCEIGVDLEQLLAKVREDKLPMSNLLRETLRGSVVQVGLREDLANVYRELSDVMNLPGKILDVSDPNLHKAVIEYNYLSSQLVTQTLGPLRDAVIAEFSPGASSENGCHQARQFMISYIREMLNDSFMVNIDSGIGNRDELTRFVRNYYNLWMLDNNISACRDRVDLELEQDLNELDRAELKACSEVLRKLEESLNLAVIDQFGGIFRLSQYSDLFRE